METTSPRRDAKIRIAVFFVLSATAFILSAGVDPWDWAGALYFAGSFALFALPKSQSAPKRSGPERVLWAIFCTFYFATLLCYFIYRGAPMRPSIAGVLCLMTFVFCMRMWRGINNTDEETLRSAFKEEEW